MHLLFFALCTILAITEGYRDVRIDVFQTGSCGDVISSRQFLSFNECTPLVGFLDRFALITTDSGNVYSNSLCGGTSVSTFQHGGVCNTVESTVFQSVKDDTPLPGAFHTTYLTTSSMCSLGENIFTNVYMYILSS